MAEIKNTKLRTFLASSLASDHLEMFRFLKQVYLKVDVLMSILVDMTTVVHFGKVNFKLVL